MPTKEKEFEPKLPRNEEAQIYHYDITGKMKWAISQHKTKGTFTLFQIKKNEAVKIATADSPVKLTKKYIEKERSKSGGKKAQKNASTKK